MSAVSWWFSCFSQGSIRQAGILARVTFPRPNVRSGPLAGHVRKGRVFRSPLSATGTLVALDWVRDDLPDLLWPVLVLSEYGTEGFHRFRHWQKAVQKDLANRAQSGFIAGCLDGRLTSLDRMADRVPEARDVVRSRGEEFGLLTRPVISALDIYPHRPAQWLTGQEMTTPGHDEIDLLGRAVRELLTDSHREAVIMCLWIWSAVQAGALVSDDETIKLLRPYPADPATRDQADSAVRGMWGAHKKLMEVDDENRFAKATQWARVFWATNSMYTRCARRSDTAEPADRLGEDTTVTAEEPVPPGGVLAAGAMPEDGAHLRRLAMDLFSSFVEALETSPSRLYDREQQEVVCGLVSRAGRDVIAALGAPDLWCLEHGAHITRMLVEVRIYIQWMAQQDPAIYRAFQDYGAGKAKLYARILDELPPEDRVPDFEAAIEDLKIVSHNSEFLDSRDVSTSDSFVNGKPVRTMAGECGLLDLYRHVYYMGSGVAHSEWWSIEMHAMEQCRNALHGGHLIPSQSLNPGGNTEFASVWVQHLYTLIRVSLQILGTDEHAAESAFSWLEDNQDDSAPSGTDGNKRS